MANINDDIKVEVTDADLVDSSLDPVSGLKQSTSETGFTCKVDRNEKVMQCI